MVTAALARVALDPQLLAALHCIADAVGGAFVEVAELVALTLLRLERHPVSKALRMVGADYLGRLPQAADGVRTALRADTQIHATVRQADQVFSSSAAQRLGVELAGLHSDLRCTQRLQTLLGRCQLGRSAQLWCGRDVRAPGPGPRRGLRDKPNGSTRTFRGSFGAL